MKAGLVKQFLVPVDLVSVYVKQLLFEMPHTSRIGVLTCYSLCESIHILPSTIKF